MLTYKRDEKGAEYTQLVLISVSMIIDKICFWI